MAKSNEVVLNLFELAWLYIDECVNFRFEKLSNKGDIVKVNERKIPTIDYFINYWIPKNHIELDTIKRATYYNWIKDDKNKERQKLIKHIDDLFNSVGKDIVANEGRGIFYAKNKYGWTDKMQQDSNIKIDSITGMKITNGD